MYQIAKEFNFEFGHRVWKQQVNPEFSLSSVCACRFQHGHSATVVVRLCGEGLNEQGMVTDFKNLNWFKQFVDDVLDLSLIHI
jgi:6-pyruvoyltetrahydropterin/6-carboxytetrahydropterin synthase